MLDYRYLNPVFQTFKKQKNIQTIKLLKIWLNSSYDHEDTIIRQTSNQG